MIAITAPSVIGGAVESLRLLSQRFCEDSVSKL